MQELCEMMFWLHFQKFRNIFLGSHHSPFYPSNLSVPRERTSVQYIIPSPYLDILGWLVPMVAGNVHVDRPKPSKNHIYWYGMVYTFETIDVDVSTLTMRSKFQNVDERILELHHSIKYSIYFLASWKSVSRGQNLDIPPNITSRLTCSFFFFGTQTKTSTPLSCLKPPHWLSLVRCCLDSQ